MKSSANRLMLGLTQSGGSLKARARVHFPEGQTPDITGTRDKLRLLMHPARKIVPYPCYNRRANVQ